ncbi:hypothetical protein ACTMTJ_12795 [Phytohabitans sp. LJ34]|uniref:hypothetical protein n=1 Tax=Phytohabitans sp. LJ34 TaxID=3452217 RepID=UPI003F8C19EE
MLDTSAIRLYAARSLEVGELIRELSDEKVRFGLPVLCFVEAAHGADKEAMSLLAVLGEHQFAEWLPLDGGQWREVAAAAHLLGTVGRACAALPVAHDEAVYVVTAHPDVYESAGLDVIAI